MLPLKLLRLQKWKKTKGSSGLCLCISDGEGSSEVTVGLKGVRGHCDRYWLNSVMLSSAIWLNDTQVAPTEIQNKLIYLHPKYQKNTHLTRTEVHMWSDGSRTILYAQYKTIPLFPRRKSKHSNNNNLKEISEHPASYSEKRVQQCCFNVLGEARRAIRGNLLRDR